MSKALFLCLATALPLAGCASTSSGSGSGSGSDADRMRVSLRDYRGGNFFELVSESHTDRLEYYSTERVDASRKIQTDEVMEALVEEIEKRGFGPNAQTGPAPRTGGEILSWSLEVQRGDGLEHWMIGPGSAPDQWRAFQTCQMMFIEIYNATRQYQTIENPEGKGLFKKGQT